MSNRAGFRSKTRRTIGPVRCQTSTRTTGKKLSMGSNAFDVVRVTGAGDQQFDALIKLVEDVLQLEDDLNAAVKQEKESKKHKKNEKEEKVRDRAEKLRKPVMRRKMMGDAGN